MAQDRLSERLAVVATIDPDAYTADTYTTDIIDMKLHKRVMFVVAVGTMATNATLDFKVQEGAAANLSDAADLSGKAITQLTEAGSDSDKQVIVEVTSEEVAAAGGRYIRGSMTVATAACDAGVIAIAGDTHYQPASEHDLASVDEIVA